MEIPLHTPFQEEMYLVACGFVVCCVPVPATVISGKHTVFLKEKAEEF